MGFSYLTANIPFTFPDTASFYIQLDFPIAFHRVTIGLIWGCYRAAM